MDAMYSNAGFEQNLEIRQGSTFAIMLVVTGEDGVTPYDLTGHTVRAALVRAGDTPGTPVEFTFVPGQASLVDGEITGVLQSSQTTPLIANNRKMAVPGYIWNCDIKKPDGAVIPFCHGKVIVPAGLIDWS